MTIACCVPACGVDAVPGLERCAAHERRRRWSRDHARRKRAAARAMRQAGRDRCQHGQGAGICGGVLRTEVDRLSMIGRTRLVCDWCERRKAGRCRDCPRPVAGMVGRALRCAVCRRVALNACADRWRAANAKVAEARHDEYRARPDVRAHLADYKRAWRKANPDKVRRQKRRAGLRQNPKVLAYQKRYRKSHPAPLARGDRQCLGDGCDAVVRGRVKKCAACKARDTERAVAMLAPLRRQAA